MEKHENELRLALLSGTYRRILLVTLVGDDAGLRRGEMIVPEWDDLDFKRGRLTVARSEWGGGVTATKGKKERAIRLLEPVELATERQNQDPIV